MHFVIAGDDDVITLIRGKHVTKIAVTIRNDDHGDNIWLQMLRLLTNMIDV